MEQNIQIERTQDSKRAAEAQKELGRVARPMQKPQADGTGPVWYVTRQNGQVVDLIREFDPCF